RGELCQLITSLALSVTEFWFDFPAVWNSPIEARILEYFLGFWCRRLRKIGISIKGEHIAEDQEQLVWKQINQLVKLEELMLFISNDRYVLPKELPILCRLKHFSISGYKGDIVSTLWQLGAGIRQLTIDSLCNLRELAFMLDFNPALRHSLTNFSFFGNSQDALPLWELICNHMHSLERLGFNSFDNDKASDFGFGWILLS